MATTPRHEKTPVSSGSSPKKRLLCSPGAPGVAGNLSVRANDDEAEKQRRRVERQNAALRSPHAPGSPRRLGTATRAGLVGGGGLNQSQLADHYASCIKLSSENKINAKNAFGLHLIDCMADMLRQQGGLTNFQAAGCTLDASAKIYSGRVDSIYADTYKMLGGLAGQERKPGQDNTDGAPGRAEGTKQADKSKKKARHSRTVEQNIESLNVKKFDLEFEVDPLFSKTSATFDEGGPRGLLLNQLATRGDTCEVVLDSNSVVMPSTMETKAATSHDPKMTDLTHLRDHLHLMRLSDLEICPDFSSFIFMDEEGAVPSNWSLHELLASTTPSKARAQQEYRYEAGQSDDEHDVSFGAPDDIADGFPDEGAGCVPMLGGDSDLVAGGNGDSVSAVPCQPGEKTLISLAGRQSSDGLATSGLMLSVAAEPNEYSYFDPQQMANWAGPKHWHLRPRSKAESGDGESTAAPGEKTRERVKRKAFEIDFSAALPAKATFAHSKATVLTKATLNKQTFEQTTLPEDLHFDVNELLQLFLNPKWKLVRVAAPSEDDDREHDGDLPWYNYQNERDCEGFCPPPGAMAGNDMPSGGGDDAVAGLGNFGGAPMAAVDDDDDYDGPCAAGSMGSMTMNNISSLADMQSFLDMSRVDPNMVLLGDNLVVQPRKVQRIQIDYAKAAKKMDVKKLKAGIWSVLVSPSEKENTPEPKKKEKPAEQDACAGSHSFKSLYETLPGQISSGMTKNLSVPIAFVCLLHLANEKNLKVAGVDGRSDLIVSQDS